MSQTANERVDGVRLTKGRDPSNTHSIQRAFLRDLQRRFRELRGLLRRTVGYENDALRLSPNADERGVFDFPTDEGKARAFVRQLRQWLSELFGLGQTPIDVQNARHWTAEYLRDAYVTGVQTAQGRLMQLGASVTASEPSEIVQRPTAVRQLRDLYTRTFENLQNITDDAARTIRTELTDGVRQGKNPRDLAATLNDEIQDLSRSRAATLARTEVINSHATAQLEEYQREGVDRVSHTSRLTAQDAQVCPWCRRLEDVPFTIEEFQNTAARWRGQTWRVGVPGHPNCRCSPMPELGIDLDDSLEERVPGTIIQR